MKNTGCETSALRSVRLRGGSWFAKTAVPNVSAAAAGLRSIAACALEVERLAYRPDACAFRDDRLELVGLGRRLEQHLAADGQPDPADPVVVDVRPSSGGTRSPPSGRACPPSRNVRIAVASPSPRRSKSSTP